MRLLYHGLPPVVITACMLSVAGCDSTNQQPPWGDAGSPASRVSTSPVSPCATDPDGVRDVRDTGEMAGKGGGYVEYRYPVPSRNFSVQKKESYALDVDGAWYVGPGYYIRNGT